MAQPRPELDAGVSDNGQVGAVPGYSVWNAYAGFDEQQAGTIAVGKRADFTVMDVAPFRMKTPAELLKGRMLTTVSRGRVVYAREK